MTNSLTTFQQELCIKTPEFGYSTHEQPLNTMTVPYATNHSKEIQRAQTHETIKKAATYDPKKLSILLDLNQTLVIVLNSIVPNGVKVELGDESSQATIWAIKRPFADEFVSKLSEVYNLFIYTASERTYAQKLLRAMKIEKYICRVYYRKHCAILADGQFQKSISKIGFDPQNTILIDDSEIHVKAQIENSLLVAKFDGDSNDKALQKLLPFLLSLSSLKDVRPLISKYFTYCSQEIENQTKKSRSSQSPSKRKIETNYPSDSSELSELSELDDFDGGKAFVGAVYSMTENPLECLRQKIAFTHFKSIREISRDQSHNSLSPVGRETLFRSASRFSSYYDELETKRGGLTPRRRSPRTLSRGDTLNTRAKFTPPPMIYQHQGCEIEIDC